MTKAEIKKLARQLVKCMNPNRLAIIRTLGCAHATAHDLADTLGWIANVPVAELRAAINEAAEYDGYHERERREDA